MKSVLITGAGAGIGAAAARALVQRGYDGHAGVRRLDDAPAGPTHGQPEVTDDAQIAAAVAQVSRATGGAGLHALINNAGIIVQGPLELTPSGEWRDQFDVNVVGPAALMRACLPLLRKGNGRVVNVSAPTA